ncbi:type VI secretion system baseplate subunit TssK [Niveibacterium sp. 24ML]|uniref:type VI secretion system baseplate subunit TssK n=1 Tax=Niveibacterium sp. 24ML TaxID=2985512 RepID=UPI0022718DF9|nr:type VI secretion system baseplate subunit TssK [Niveibacterium sp. 24ML]MCX9154814.1 type VI secretion system baseplate subunit TssK [Niveibacterium sp. 24ML]
MTSAAKVLWGEGLFLRPQHFQRQDLYHETRLAELSRTLHPYAWGFRNLRIDKEALASGILRLDEIRAVFPDGDFYAAPDADELPDPVNLSQREFSSDAITFHLALAHLRQSGGNHAQPGDNRTNARFRPASEHAPDLFTRAAEADVMLLRKQPRLLSENDALEQFVTLPAVRVRKTSTGGYELDPSFMAPAASIDALPTLLAMLRRTLDILQAKCAALYGFHREPSRNIVEVRSGDIASFWLLHTASSAYARLSHLFRHPRLHPERLFEGLLEVAGALMTFSKSYTLDDLPSYDHLAPAPSFFKLDRIIRELLETVISTRCATITLNETKPSFYVGRLDGEKLNEGTSFYLAVSADMPPPELVEAVPLRFKLGAPDDVDKLLLSAMPGVKITAAPQVPAAIPVRPGNYYFSIEPSGPLFERMLQAQTIAVYTPSGFRDLRVELFALVQ